MRAALAGSAELPGSAAVTAPAGEPMAGQSTAELAVLLPVLLILILSVVQVAVVARDYVAVQHAAREGARRAAVDPTVAGAAAGAREATGLDPDRLDVTTRGDPAAGQVLTVAVGYRSPTEVPLVGRLVGDVELTAEAAVRVE